MDKTTEMYNDISILKLGRGKRVGFFSVISLTLFVPPTPSFLQCYVCDWCGYTNHSGK